MQTQYLEEIKEAFEGSEWSVRDAAGSQHHHVQAGLQLKYDQVKRSVKNATRAQQQVQICLQLKYDPSKEYQKSEQVFSNKSSTEVLRLPFATWAH